jgi:NAD(P)-dependent dehydrogenase (short-subunit alcohol dehydrogenase family)
MTGDKGKAMYTQKYDLRGGHAVVTGGGRAIGPACVEDLAEAGAKLIIIAAADDMIAAEGQAEMKAKGFDVDVVMMDVTKSVEVTAVADGLAGKHHGVGILVNNAGIARSDTPAETVADEILASDAASLLTGSIVLADGGYSCW